MNIMQGNPTKPFPPEGFKSRLTRWTAWTGCAMLLAGVFVLYGDGDLVMTLSQQIWSCFGAIPR